MTGDLDLVHVITRERSELAAFMTQARKRTVLNGMICGSWLKKASKVRTDIAEDIVRELAFPLELVDVKVCVVEATWSGSKRVIHMGSQACWADSSRRTHGQLSRT